jgi:hypothetical protein
VISVAAARSLAVGDTATIQGTITVEPNRLPDASLIGVQDATAGIYVNLPAGAPALNRGNVVLVSGTLAAPYGNLELRPDDASQVVIVGTAPVPALTAVSAAQVGEASEGLLASVAGTLTQIDSTTTSLTLFFDDGTGEARIFITSDLGTVRTDFVLGSQVSVHILRKARIDNRGIVVGLRDALVVDDGDDPPIHGPVVESLNNTRYIYWDERAAEALHYLGERSIRSVYNDTALRRESFAQVRFVHNQCAVVRKIITEPSI